MGTSQSQNVLWYSTNQELVLSENNLTYVRTQKDVRLGEVDEFQHIMTKELLSRKEILLEDQTQLTPDNLRKLKARVQLKHENLLTIYGFSLENESDGPSKIGIFFETFLSEAATEFRSRAKEQSFFDEEELYTTLLPVIQALAYLQKYMISHGHVMPEAILMSREAEIKIIDHSLFEKEHSAYAACLRGVEISYLAPELFTLLDKSKDSFTDFDPFKADAFALGMTFLHGALLEEPADCYNWETHVFDAVKLSKRIERVRDRYPGRFGNLLRHLLKLDVAERPDAQTLIANIQGYENSEFYKRENSGSYQRHEEFQNHGMQKKHELSYRSEKPQEHNLASRHNPKVEPIKQQEKPTQRKIATEFNYEPQYQFGYNQKLERPHSFENHLQFDQPSKYEKSYDFEASHRHEPQNYDYHHKYENEKLISRFNLNDKPNLINENRFEHYYPSYFKPSENPWLNKENRAYSISSSYMLDPRVKEIVKEINERKLLDKPELSKFDHRDIHTKKSSDLGYISHDHRSSESNEYRSPKSNDHHHYSLLPKTSLATSGFIYPQLTKEVGENNHDPMKLVFNSPEVNEVIAKVRARHQNTKSQTTEPIQSVSLSNSNYLEQPIVQRVSDRDKPIETSTNLVGLGAAVGIHKKKEGAVSEFGKAYWKSEAGFASNSSNIELLQSKSQAKEDIMKDLKEKYGRKKRSDYIGSDQYLNN